MSSRQINRTDQNYPEGRNKFFRRNVRFSSFTVERVSCYFQNGEKGVNPEEKTTSPGDALNATHGAVESSDSSSLVDWQLMTVRTREVVPALSPDSTSDDNWDYYARLKPWFYFFLWIFR